MKTLKKDIKTLLQKGTVIPAYPLALDAGRKLDEKRQRLLTRYYLASGAGGLAVGVHTTQFAIRDKNINLYEPVLKIASEEIANANLGRPVIKVAGILGPVDQAIREAEIAVTHNYDLGLLSVGGLDHLSEKELIKRTEKVMEVIPVFGFYLQPAAGGRLLSFDFWKDFARLPGVHAIKLAPFNRYHTIDVVRAVCHSPRFAEIALYTGNDDNVVVDLLTKFRFMVNGVYREKEIVGGLLGHWAMWTGKAVELLNEIRQIKKSEKSIPAEMLTKSIAVTDANAAFFDAANGFSGCIPGIHEVLRRQGLLEGIRTLDPKEVLSEGQSAEIDRVYRDYPDLHDDEFVRQNLKNWQGE